jgi:hypothetical protein
MAFLNQEQRDYVKMVAGILSAILSLLIFLKVYA